MESQQSVGLSHRGLVRSENQDSWLAYGRERGPMDALLVVADGMGGHVGGREASDVAVEVFAGTVVRELERGPLDDEVVRLALRMGFAEAHAGVRALADKLTDRESAQPGTTLTCALIFGDRCYIGHVGDTRAYVVSAAGAKQVTHDHTWVADEVREGRMSPDEAARSPFRNQVLQALGARADISPDVLLYNLAPGETVLLCSDGLHEYASTDEIAARVGRASDLGQAADELLKLALDGGGEDNVTVVLSRSTRSITEAPTVVMARPQSEHDTAPIPAVPPRRRVSRLRVVALVLAVLGLVGMTIGAIGLARQRARASAGGAEPTDRLELPAPPPEDLPPPPPPPTVSPRLDGTNLEMTLSDIDAVLVAKAAEGHEAQLKQINSRLWIYQLYAKSVDPLQRGEADIELTGVGPTNQHDPVQSWSPDQPEDWELVPDEDYVVQWAGEVQVIEMLTLRVDQKTPPDEPDVPESGDDPERPE